MGVGTNESRRARLLDVLIAVVVFGSLWGLSEVILSGAMKAVGIPLRTGIMTGVGIGIMAIAFGIFRKPLMLPGIAVMAVLCKQLVVPILHVSIMCKANSCLAVGLQGFALAGMVSLAGRRLHRGILLQMAGAASAALLARGAFYFAGMRLAPCPHLLSFNYAGGFIAFMALGALAWGASSALLFPLGYRAGAWLRDPVLALGTRKPLVYYATSAVSVVCCWVASAFVISAGF